MAADEKHAPPSSFTSSVSQKGHNVKLTGPSAVKISEYECHKDDKVSLRRSQKTVGLIVGQY